MRRLDIGIASYGNPTRLAACLRSIGAHSVTDYRVFVIHNPGGNGDDQARSIIKQMAAENPRIVPIWQDVNTGYVGAVNKLLQLAESEYVGYCDNDIEILTPGWDERLISIMETNPEVGWAFPGPGHYGFENGRYRECLWNAGYCWILRRSAQSGMAGESPLRYGGGGPGLFDSMLGHHEEVDFMIRLRLAGWRIACDKGVNVIHHETATKSSDAAHKPGGRIHDGVVRWMNKWNHYFCGDGLQYSMMAYDPRALRYTDWNVDALYLERMTLHYFPTWNTKPEIVVVPGIGEMEAVKILKPKGCYVGRAI